MVQYTLKFLTLLKAVRINFVNEIKLLNNYHYSMSINEVLFVLSKKIVESNHNAFSTVLKKSNANV